MAGAPPVRSALWQCAARCAGGFVLCSTVDDRYFQLHRPRGPSMLPTIRADGDLALLDRRCLRRYDFSRGDVVVFREPTGRRVNAVQRLIALPGDWIQVPEKREIRQIPQGHCWVEGDGPNGFDSRVYGPVPLGLMVGRITHIVWPPDRICRVNRMVPEGRIMPRH